MPGAAFPRPERACRLPPPGQERNPLSPPRSRLGAGPGRVQHRGQLLLPRGGRRSAPPVPAPGGVQHRGQLRRPAHPLARACPPPPLPPRAGPLLPATHTLHRPFPLASSRLRPSDPNDPPPETPRAGRAVSVGREHLCTARPGPLHFLGHVAAVTKKFT